MGLAGRSWLAKSPPLASSGHVARVGTTPGHPNIRLCSLGSLMNRRKFCRNRVGAFSWRAREVN